MSLSKALPRAVTVIAALAVIVLACVLIRHVREERRSQRRAIGFARNYARGDMLVLFEAISDFAIDHPATFEDAVTNGPSRLLDWPALHAMILKDNTGTLTHRLRTTGKLLDLWGGEFHLSVASLPGVTNGHGQISRRYEVTIRSNGPDRVDNHGTGDDVVYTPPYVDIFP